MTLCWQRYGQDFYELDMNTKEWTTLSFRGPTKRRVGMGLAVWKNDAEVFASSEKFTYQLIRSPKDSTIEACEVEHALGYFENPPLVSCCPVLISLFQ
jgi:hypothetical protein